jgi:ribosomal protein L14
VNVTVNAAANQAPVANAGANLSITLPVNSVTLNGSASSDPDGTIASYAWSQVSGPTTAALGTAGAVSTTAGGLVQGNYVFRLTVTDNNGAKSTDDISVAVNAAVNQAPAANAGANLSITLPTSSVTLNGSASSDPDGTIASYAWSQVSGPSTATLGTAGSATTTAGGLVQGNYVFRLTVTDNDGAKSTDDISVVVNAAVNKVPVANAGANLSITLPTSSVTLDGSTSSDPDGTIASYVWSQVSGPSTATLGAAGSESTTAGGLVQGNYVFRLTVTDNDGAKSTDDISVLVNPAPNKAPIANAGPSQNLVLPVSDVMLDGTASYDPDGTIVSYSWLQVSGVGGVSITNSNTATPSLYGLKVGTYVFQLTVKDNAGAEASDQVSVVVSAAGTPPPAAAVLTANAGADTTVSMTANNGAMLNGSASTDAGGTITGYEWTQVSGPDGAAIASPASVTSLVSNLAVGVYVFQLAVTDDKGNRDSATVQVRVIDNRRNSSSLEIYPNPAHDIVNLKISDDNTGKVKITLFDMGGRIVKTEETDKTGLDLQTTINVSQLASGVYGVQIQIGTKTRMVSRVVKQ